MKQKIAQLIERFPDHESIFKALSRSSGPFRVLLQDHHDLHRQLNREDTAGDPLKRAELEARYRNLEEELVRLAQGYPMA